MADGLALLDQQLLLPTPPEHDEERLRFFCVDRTPLGVVGQGMQHAVRKHLKVQGPERRTPVILDVGAGDGPFSAVLKRMYPRSHRVAVEIRPECEPHLRRHAQEVIIGPFLDHQHQPDPRVPKAHIIVGNPPFTDGDGLPLWIPIWRACFDLLLPGGLMVLLGLNEVGQRGKKDHQAFTLLPPHEQAHIAGPIKFRGVNRGADMRCCSWWIRRAGPVRRSAEVSWKTTHLPWLPKEDREWRTIPGHEP